MARVLTFSRTFPAYHPKAGQATFFVEQIYNAIDFKIGHTKQSGDIPKEMWDIVNDFVLLDGEMKKYHTIRAGNRWKAGDKFSPRVWSGKPYNSKQIQFAPDMEVKKVWDIKIEGYCIWINKEIFSRNHKKQNNERLALNDGLTVDDFWDWFPCKPGNIFTGQIICWNENIEY